MAEASISPQLNSKKRGRMLLGAFGSGSKQKQQELVASANLKANPETTEALELLDKILSDRIARNKLITAVGKWELHPSPTSMIRFCVAVDEFEKTKEKVEKRSRGRKIIAMFIQSGSMFQLQLQEIPAEYVVDASYPIRSHELTMPISRIHKGLLQEKFENLLLLRSRFLNELAANEILIAKIKELEL